MSKPIYVLNGPNLNLLGGREPDVYGTDTLDDIRLRLQQLSKETRCKIEFRQTNSEGEFVDWIQEARLEGAALIINAGAYSHTSIAILDALNTLTIPSIEVHLSNIFSREPFRHHSYISQAVMGVICGFGAIGYELALKALVAKLPSD